MQPFFLWLHGEYALAVAKRLQGMFGEDFYIELQNHGIPEQLQVLPGLRRVAADIGARCVATNDVHYVSPDDAEAQDVLLCIQTQRFVDEIDRMRMEGQQFYLKSADEMLLALPDDAELLADLATPKFDVKTSGIQIEGKDEIKKRLGRSPDKGDAVVMCLAPGNLAVKRQINGSRAAPRVVLAYANAKKGRR